MTTTPPSTLATLHATANTRQCHNAFFRQHQLKSLHDIFLPESSRIIAAIQKDTSVSRVEATTEYALALSIIKDNYKAIHPASELEYDNSIANGKNAERKREPWGVVYIDPDLNHTPFYSIVVAVSTAVVAGNCVALKLENSLRELPSLLRTLFPRALNADNFAVLCSIPSTKVLYNTLEVLQHTPVSFPTYAQLASSSSHVVAIVDRTADLSAAAKDLVTARFAFGGTSPYAPDLVLINEFKKEEFMQLVLQHSIRFLANSTSASAKDVKKDNRPFDPSASKGWDARVITQGNSGSVIELVSKNRKNLTLPAKQTSPTFIISAVTSLDHAIDLVSSNGSQPVLAAYHFADQRSANYLARFVDAEITFVNHVPTRLLLGPAAPAFQPFDLERRYTMSHFLRPTPAFALSQARDKQIFETQKEADELLREASQEIKESKRREWMSHGFFEQGIFIGLGIYGVPILTCVGAGLFYAVRTGMRYVARF